MRQGRYMVQHWPCPTKDLQLSKPYSTLNQAQKALEGRNDGHQWIVWGRYEHEVVLSTTARCDEQGGNDG